jgi:ferritin-like metal-binding protein YciE
MTRKINSLQELLARQLEELYDGEKRLQHDLHARQSAAARLAFKEELQKFESQCSDARMKLKRIFSYLLMGPFKIKSNTISGFIKDLDMMASSIADVHDREMFTRSSFLCINTYKVTAYNSALDISHKLALDPVSDLLNEIIATVIGCDTKLQKMQALSS